MSTRMWDFLPAGGLGKRDPNRPYVTGGLGAGVSVLFDCLSGNREPIYGLIRNENTGERLLVFGQRVLFDEERTPVEVNTRTLNKHLQRTSEPISRTPSMAHRSPTTVNERVLVSAGSRTPPSGNREPPQNDVC